MPRHTQTVNYSYGENSDRSFGDLLLQCLTFPRAELEADYGNSLEAGNEVQPTTPEKVAKAVRSKVKADVGQRLRDRKPAKRAA